MTPFEAIYGRSPPSIQQFLPGEIKSEAVTQELATRDELLRQLTFNLHKAQQRMTKAANKRRRDVLYKAGDSVFLKFCPHR